TAIVNLSHILFKSAYIHDVAAIAAKARQVGACTVIDGYQAVGTIPVDVRSLGIDVYIGGCLKWLCGGPPAAVARGSLPPPARRGVRRGRSQPAREAGTEADRLDGPPAAVYVRARVGAPRRCLAIPPWHTQHLWSLRGAARPADRQ